MAAVLYSEPSAHTIALPQRRHRDARHAGEDCRPRACTKTAQATAIAATCRRGTPARDGRRRRAIVSAGHALELDFSAGCTLVGGAEPAVDLEDEQRRLSDLAQDLGPRLGVLDDPGDGQVARDVDQVERD